MPTTRVRNCSEQELFVYFVNGIFLACPLCAMLKTHARMIGCWCLALDGRGSGGCSRLLISRSPACMGERAAMIRYSRVCNFLFGLCRKAT